MNLYISFSAASGGNCDKTARFLARENDKIVCFRDLGARGCVDCAHECFSSRCRYSGDSVYELYRSMRAYQRVILIVPMYCGNPSSLYFAFNERGQDYFMLHGENYENVLKKLFIIGIYGSRDDSPDFIPCLEKWFEGSKYSNHVLGIERHRYGLKIGDSMLDVEDIRSELCEFIYPTKATEELSAMAVVMCGDNILATRELIYGRETLSLPKGHKEDGETIAQCAIRECFEETGVTLTETDITRELESFSYQFLTPSNQLIRKTIVPFLFEVQSEGEPVAKEERMIWAGWMSKEDFLRSCTHENVKAVVQSI